MIDILLNTKFWGMIIVCFLCIILGFILRKKNIFDKNSKKPLMKVIMNIAIPALTLVGFMNSITLGELKQQGIILLISFLYYGLMCLLSYLWVRFFPTKIPRFIQDQINEKLENEPTEEAKTAQKVILKNEAISKIKYKSMLIWMMLTFGATILFGMPIIEYVCKDEGGLLSANIASIPYRIFLYSYCLVKLTDIKITKENVKESTKKIFLNPVVICTIIGIILWTTQLIPGAGKNIIKLENIYKTDELEFLYSGTFGKNFKTIYATGTENNLTWYIKSNNKWMKTNEPSSWFEFKNTLEFVYFPLKILAGLCSPLIWIVTGISLAESNLKKAVKDKWIWIYCFLKLIILPLLTLGLLYFLNKYAGINKNVSLAMLISAATPVAAVVISYALNEGREDEFVAGISSMSTLLSVFIIPIFIIIGQVVFI